jgi:hypothetical protein
MSTKNTGNREEDERSLLDQLLEDSRLYKSSQDYLNLLEFIARMRNFAPFNALLLQIQKPGLHFAASRHDWRKRFHAEVKEDARPLLILWPFGPVALVYDVVDLVSGNIPVDAQSFVAKGPMTDDRITTFIERMKSKDIAVSITDAGDRNAGSIQMTKLPKDEKTRGCYKMKINGNHTPDVRFVTIAHELAHLFLGHLGEDKKWGIKERLRCTHTQRELEAESVAFLVAKRNGVKSRSETYLANYVRENPTMEDLDFYQMTRAAGQIETLLGIAAHTRFDPHDRQPSSPEISQDSVTYTQRIPQDQIMEIVKVVHGLYDAGAREPKDFAANLGKIEGGRLKPYSQALWCLLRASYPALPDVENWDEVYRSIDSQVAGAAYPEIHKHPINKAAMLRMKKEGMDPPSFQNLPILYLAYQVLIQEGEEDTQTAIDLVASGEYEMEQKTAILAESLTPKQIMEDDLDDLAAAIFAELREPIIRI